MLPLMIDRAIDAIHAGLIVGLPTDTVYGIGADPFDEDAVESLFAAKGRPGVKPIPILAAGLEELGAIARIDEATRDRVAPLWPGGLTLVLPRLSGMPRWLGDHSADSVGVRVPDHAVALELLRAVGPLAVTSANRSEDAPTRDEVEARTALGGAVAVYLVGRGSGGPPSTVVDLTGPSPRVLRRGAVEWPTS